MVLILRIISKKDAGVCVVWPTWLDSILHSAFDSTGDSKMELQLSGSSYVLTFSYKGHVMPSEMHKEY